MTALKTVMLAAALIAATISLTMARNSLHYTKRGHSPGLCGSDLNSCCCYSSAQKNATCVGEGFCLNHLGGSCAVTGC